MQFYQPFFAPRWSVPRRSSLYVPEYYQQQPQYYVDDDDDYYSPPTQRRRSQRPQPHRRERVEYFDPWAEHRQYEEQQQLRLQQRRQQQLEQQQEFLRQQQLRQQQLRHHQQQIRQQQQQQMQQRKQMLAKYNKAAGTIQRAFRCYLDTKRHRAACTIQRAYRHHINRQFARQSIIEPLQRIQQLISQLEAHCQQWQLKAYSKRLQFDPHGRVRFTNESKDFLAYEDGLLKLMIHVDGIVSGGEECVRRRRKDLVLAIQKLLDKADDFRRQQLDEAYQSDDDEEMLSIDGCSLFA